MTKWMGFIYMVWTALLGALTLANMAIGRWDAAVLMAVLMNVTLTGAVLYFMPRTRR